MRAGKSGFSAVKAGNRDLYVAYAPVAGTTFSLGIAAKQSTLLSVVADLQKQVKNTTDEMVYSRILPFGAGLLVLVWILSFFFIKRYTDPLKQLTATTAQLSGGNFDVQPAKVSLDNEIGQLASSFNSMVADLKASHTKIEDQNKELIREQLRLKASINSMPFGFAIVNPENEIVFHNAVLAHLMNRDIPDTPAASRRVLEAVSTEYKATIDLLSCLKTTLDSRQPTEHGVEIGPRFFRFFFAPIIDEVDGAEQAIGTVMVMEDTTEARAMERSRDEFFSIASHELRTPLTAIRGNSKMIIDYFGDQLKDPSLKEMVGDIHESSLRLITIVNDFLDTSRLEQGKMVFKKESLNLPDLMAKTIREFDADDTRNGNVLEFKPADTPIPAVMADAERVQQIIINLLSNAFKFTDKGVVTIALGLSGPDKIKISVADTGKGIPMESQHLLFHKFQQASNNILTRDNTRSTGLGLYISKLMAEGMGGRLYLESTEVDKGSVFALELPVGEAGGVEPAKPARKSAAESKNVSVKVKPS